MCLQTSPPGFSGASLFFGPQNYTLTRGLKAYGADIQAVLLPRTWTGGVSGIMLAAGNTAGNKVAGYIC